MPKKGEGGVTVLNEEKITIMVHLAKCEKKENESNFTVMNFYKSDYIRYNLLKTFVSVTIGYILILGLIMFYQAEYLIANAVTLDYKAIATTAVGIYFLLLLLYEVVTAITCFLKYDKSQKYTKKYYKSLDVLRRFYGSETEQE